MSVPLRHSLHSLWRSRSPGGWCAFLAVWALALLWLYPFAWMALSSLKVTRDINSTSLFSGRFTLANYYFLFSTAKRIDRPFLGALGVSCFVTLSVTAAVVVSSIFIAYALARIRFPGAKLFQHFLLFQMVVPTMMFTLPMFVLIKQLGLLNSYSALILPSVMSGWGIYMMAQSFRALPEDYLDAARLDNATMPQILRRVVVPLNKPIIAIVALFTFSGSWDNFLWPLIVMSDIHKMPLSVLLASFSKQYGAYVGPVLAGAVLQTMPLVLPFVIFRRHFLHGIALSLK